MNCICRPPFMLCMKHEREQCLERIAAGVSRKDDQRTVDFINSLEARRSQEEAEQERERLAVNAYRAQKELAK